MIIIPCSNDCIYQKEGYCNLENPSAVTSVNEKECLHYIKKEAKHKSQLPM